MLGHTLKQAEMTFSQTVDLLNRPIFFNKHLSSLVAPKIIQQPCTPLEENKQEVIQPPPLDKRKEILLSHLKKYTQVQVNAHLMRGYLPLPPRLTCHTRYQISRNLANVGGVSTSGRLTPTFCYDIDPLFGSTAMPFLQKL